jgi:two-component system chemotaxis sensor kinase CheA
VGLVVDRILDTVETTVELQRPATRPGVLGSAIIHQRVTELLDLPSIFREADPSFFEPLSAAGGSY